MNISETKASPCSPEDFDLQSFVGFMLISMGMFTVSGCGGSQPDPRGARVGVHGEIMLDGLPLSRATIIFLPSKGTAKVRATGTIANGVYEIAAENGPLAGNCRVEIHPETIDLEELEAARGDSRRTAPRELNAVSIPSRYNSRSKLMADVTPDGENAFNFKLESGRR